MTSDRPAPLPTADLYRRSRKQELRSNSGPASVDVPMPGCLRGLVDAALADTIEFLDTNPGMGPRGGVELIATEPPAAPPPVPPS